MGACETRLGCLAVHAKPDVGMLFHHAGHVATLGEWKGL